MTQPMRTRAARGTLNHKVSVVIPVKNAGADFPRLLSRLKSQTGVREIEIIVVDSGSTDSTLAWARKHGCKVLRLAPSAFSHSRARNIGARQASGDYVLFMVQDALPSGNGWMNDFLGALLRHAPQGVVAATCREFPRMDSDVWYGFLTHAHHHEYMQWRDEDRITAFESDDPTSLRRNGSLNNIASLFRRSILSRYEFRGSFAEDLDLGIRLIKDGHKLALLSSVRVIHSHNRSPFYFLKRSFVGAISMIDQAVVPVPQHERPADVAASVHLLFRTVDALSRKLACAWPGTPSAELWHMIDRELPLEWARQQAEECAPAAGAYLREGELRRFLHEFCPMRGSPRFIDLIMSHMQVRCRDAGRYLQPIYPIIDEYVASELQGFLFKQAGFICGQHLGGMCAAVQDRAPSRRRAARLRAALTEAI